MTNCHRCKEPKLKTDLLGCNVFDASTGMHITTHWYCMLCALSMGLIVND